MPDVNTENSTMSPEERWAKLYSTLQRQAIEAHEFGFTRERMRTLMDVLHIMDVLETSLGAVH